MRIVGGKLGGRPLAAPMSRAIRPTSDRLRQTLFDVLTHAYDHPVTDANVLDLFAGTGALGLEALSRGARSAVFVDDDPAACALVRRNIERLGVVAVSQVLRRDVRRLGVPRGDECFTLVFIDPPYGRGLGEVALSAAETGGWLARSAICVLEEDKRARVAPVAGLERLESRVIGDSQLIFLKRM